MQHDPERAADRTIKGAAIGRRLGAIAMRDRRAFDEALRRALDV